MPRFLILSLLVFSLLITPVIAQEEPNQVGSGGIGGRPALPREDNPRTKSIFIQTLEPGETGKDAVKVINNAEEPKSILVYATDTALSNDGAFACQQLVDENTDVGDWIKLGKSQVTLEPSSSEVIDFTIKVPMDANVGEHNGCIVIQEAKTTSESEQGIGLSFRSAIRVAILVPGDIQKQLDIVELKGGSSTENVTLTPVVKNSGNVSVDAAISTELRTLWGAELTESGGEFPVLRDQTGVWNFAHNKPFWGGIYKTAVEVSYNDSASNFIGDSGANNISIHTQGPLLLVAPSPLALIIELLLIIVVGSVVYKIYLSKKIHKQVKDSWITYEVTSGDDIKSIASEHNISWKRLVNVNNIKPPFSLKEGQNLQVPPVNAKKEYKK
jgi:hypothetical protein